MSRSIDDRDYSYDEIHPPPEHLWVWPESKPESAPCEVCGLERIEGGFCMNPLCEEREAAQR